MPAETILEHYHGLWQVEQCFRVSKKRPAHKAHLPLDTPTCESPYRHLFYVASMCTLFILPNQGTPTNVFRKNHPPNPQ